MCIWLSSWNPAIHTYIHTHMIPSNKLQDATIGAICYPKYFPPADQDKLARCHGPAQPGKQMLRGRLLHIIASTAHLHMNVFSCPLKIYRYKKFSTASPKGAHLTWRLPASHPPGAAPLAQHAALCHAPTASRLLHSVPCRGLCSLMILLSSNIGQAGLLTCELMSVAPCLLAWMKVVVQTRS